MSDPVTRKTTSQRRLGIATAIACTLGMWCWVEARTLHARAGTYEALVTQIEGMARDAVVIESLKTAPLIAAEHERPNDELLAEVKDALDAAKIPLERWIGNDPAPAVRIPKSPYKRLSVRLTLDALTLRQLVQFAYQLADVNSSLHVSDLRLSVPQSRTNDTWNVEVTVSYLIYAPYRQE